MKNILRIIGSAAALALAVPTFAWAADGKAVYEKSCAKCHGADGKGDAAKEKAFKLEPGTLNLGRDAVAKQTKAEKRAITAGGKDKMPGYEKKLTAEELDAAMDHVMELIAAIRK
jgi:mono/diheme cytochrome c family protein